MLSEEQRNLIRLEEAYRVEVREQLTKQNTPTRPVGARVLAFFQSSLGTWLLSAIFITGLGAVWTRWQNARADERRTNQTIERLDVEIAYRLSRIQIQLFNLADHAAGDSVMIPGADSTAAVRELVKGLTVPLGKEQPGLYPEYTEFSALALMAELRRFVPSDQREQLDQVIAHASGLPVLLSVEKARTSNPRELARIVLRRFRLPRWGANEFYFLDCGEREPFC